MALISCSLTNILLVLALLLLGYTAFNLYPIFYPPQCSRSEGCIQPHYPLTVPLELWVYSSSQSRAQASARGMEKLLHWTDLTQTMSREESVNVTLPKSALNNGSLYAHVFLGPKGKSPMASNDVNYISVGVVPLTRYSLLQSSSFNLSGNKGSKLQDVDHVISHWIPWLSVRSLNQDFVFDPHNTPPDLASMIRLAPHSHVPKYLPFLYLDRLQVRQRELMPLGPTNVTVSLLVQYSPLAVGKLKIYLFLTKFLNFWKYFGLTEKGFELYVERFALDTSFSLFALILFVSLHVIHFLFDFLALKNEIHFWRHCRTTIGLSTTTFMWYCFSHSVLFLYHIEEKSSLLVVVPAGISTLIEYWKLLRIFKTRMVWTGLLPSLKRGIKGQSETDTDTYDKQAVRILSYLLLPLVLVGAAYQLVYSSQKSWYSWVINSLAKGVYAFGFLFMLPQLFLNYKLKSVAHLPWRAFMYKAFNTFIDDVFVFIIATPTAHRIAVFRNDMVFLIYLYQCWLYPVDKSRLNEYGESFDSKEHQD